MKKWIQRRTLIDEKAEDAQNGKYYFDYRSLHWSLNLATNTITLNLVGRNGSPVTTRVINKEQPEAEFNTTGLYAKISANFDSKQLILNGVLSTRTWEHHPARRRYENVVITSW